MYNCQTEIYSERGRDIDDDGDNEGDEAINMKMKIDIILSSTACSEGQR